MEILTLMYRYYLEIFALYTFIIYMIDSPIPNKVCFPIFCAFIILMLLYIYLTKFKKL